MALGLEWDLLYQMTYDELVSKDFYFLFFIFFPLGETTKGLHIRLTIRSSFTDLPQQTCESFAIYLASMKT